MIRWFFFFSVFIFLISFSSAGIFETLFSPDYAPFDTSVTIAGNAPPFIHDLTDPIYICENLALSSWFNVTDLDGDALVMTIDPTIPFPFSPFILNPASTSLGTITSDIEITSGNITKRWIDQSIGSRLYVESIFANDGFSIASAQTDITVIEINNPPEILNPLGVQTIWTMGDFSIFSEKIFVNDVEDGDQDDGNLIFNLTFFGGAERLFNITQSGDMFFIPDVSQIGVYTIGVCVEDLGISPTHSLIIPECGQDGSPITSCFNFSLTVTDQNRPPQILSFYPEDLNFSWPGTSSLYFNVSARDPDGTLPDVLWYVDNQSIEYDPGLNASNMTYEFNYEFGCGIGGEHNVTVYVTDGLLNTTLQWNVTVESIACPSGNDGGGGGGGGGSRCEEKWGCPDWLICQNTDRSLNNGSLSGNDYIPIREQCNNLSLDGEDCGFQLRVCEDVNSCNTSLFEPIGIQQCSYVDNPNCNDGIKNCHGGKCELLVDCGGVCGACSTCSDGIKNQGERGVDCEGPCPLDCPSAVPLNQRNSFWYVVTSIIVILLIVILIKVIKIYKSYRKINAEAFSANLV